MPALLLSVRETCEMLSIGRTTAYRLIHDGVLETVKIGRKTLVKAASIKVVAGEIDRTPRGDA